MEKTKGFVLKTLKYGDTSVILHIYTKSIGMQSFIIKGFFTNKKLKQRHLQFPFSLVELAFQPSNKSDLHIPRQIQLATFYVNAHKNPIKLIILQFLAEVVYYVLREDQNNQEIYYFIKRQIELFDKKESHLAEFHLFFLSELTKFLGFYPNMQSSQKSYFDLQEANFINKNAQYRLSEVQTRSWARLFQDNFDITYKNQFTSIEREELTASLLIYYKLHVPGFREPKSLEILKQILHS